MTIARRLSHTTTLAGLWIGLAALPGTAMAGSVYRCGQTYQQTPCAGGNVVDVTDDRSAELARERRAATAKDQHLAKTLVSERHEREKATRPQTQAVGLPAARPALPASAPAATGTACKQRGKSKGNALRCVGDTPLYVAPKAAAVDAKIAPVR